MKTPAISVKEKTKLYIHEEIQKEGVNNCIVVILFCLASFVLNYNEHFDGKAV